MNKRVNKRVNKSICIILSLLWAGLVQAETAEPRTIELSLPVSGVIQQVDVGPGERIKRGQVLLKLDPRRYQLRLQQAEAALQEVQVDLEDVELELNFQLDLFERMVSTESDLKAAKRAAKRVRAQRAQRRAQRDEAALDLELSVLKAPVDGVVLKRFAEPGEVVSSRDHPPVLLLMGVE